MIKVSNGYGQFILTEFLLPSTVTSYFNKLEDYILNKTDLKSLYKVMFTEYPDVVNVEQLSEMLGGISDKTIYRLLKSGAIKSLYVGKRYLIPKAYVLEYLSTPDAVTP